MSVGVRRYFDGPAFISRKCKSNPPFNKILLRAQPTSFSFPPWRQRTLPSNNGRRGTVRIRGHFVRITYLYRWYFYRISLLRKWHYIIVSHIVLLILQLTDGTIQTNNHTIGFGEEVAAIWHVKITKIRVRFSHSPYRIVYQNRTYMVKRSYIYRLSFVHRSNIA